MRVKKKLLPSQLTLTCIHLSSLFFGIIFCFITVCWRCLERLMTVIYIQDFPPLSFISCLSLLNILRLDPSSLPNFFYSAIKLLTRCPSPSVPQQFRSHKGTSVFKWTREVVILNVRTCFSGVKDWHSPLLKDVLAVFMQYGMLITLLLTCTKNWDLGADQTRKKFAVSSISKSFCLILNL